MWQDVDKNRWRLVEGCSRPRAIVTVKIISGAEATERFHWSDKRLKFANIEESVARRGLAGVGRIDMSGHVEKNTSRWLVRRKRRKKTIALRW